MDVRGPGLDLAVLGGREQVQVLAHEALVVGDAAHEVGRDADDVPVGGDLRLVLGVEAEDAPAHLLDRHAGGGDRHVDQHVQRRAVPALAEQRSRADEAGRVALDEQPRGELHPRARHPLGALGLQRHEQAVELALPLGELEVVLGGGLQRLEQELRVVGDAAQAAAGDQQRARARGAVVGGDRQQRVAGGAGGGVEDAGERVVWALGGELGVGEHEAAEELPARLALGGQDLDEPERLGLRVGQQAVDLGRAAADALAGELEAEVSQRGGDRVVAVGGLARALRGEVAQRVVLEQHEPVVEVGRLAVGLAPGRAGGDLEVAREQEAHAGAGELRAALLELGPGQLGVVVGAAPAVAHAADDPLGEPLRRRAAS